MIVWDICFESLGLDQAAFEEAYRRICRNSHVVLKRQVNEVWIASRC